MAKVTCLISLIQNESHTHTLALSINELSASKMVALSIKLNRLEHAEQKLDDGLTRPASFQIQE